TRDWSSDVCSSDLDTPDQLGVGVLGGSEDKLVPMRVQQVDEAGIRLRDLDGDVNDVMQDGVEIQIAADRIADLVEDFRFACLFAEGPLKGGHGGSTVLLHLSRLRSGTRL